MRLDSRLCSKMFREMRVLDFTLVNGDSIVQIRVKISSEVLLRSINVIELYIERNKMECGIDL